MVCGGITLKGSYHDLNQDCFKCYSDSNVTVIVASDGVGSKQLSDLGSREICEIVVNEVKKLSMSEIICDSFLVDIQRQWHNKTKIYGINNCCCTVLLCVVKEGKAFLAQLGDGLAGIINGEEVSVLYDNKEEHYVNETDCLSEILNTEDWKTSSVEIGKHFGAVLCTDGIGIFPEEESVYKQFIEELVLEYQNMNKTEIITSIKKWLCDWPGNDDKTIAFIIGEEGDYTNDQSVRN